LADETVWIGRVIPERKRGWLCLPCALDVWELRQRIGLPTGRPTKTMVAALGSR
jgi:hypothetical protein